MATYQRPKSTKTQKTDAAEKIVHRLDKGSRPVSKPSSKNTRNN